MTNKIIKKAIRNGDDYYYSGTGGGEADVVLYDNSVSGLSSDNVQDAIDEIAQHQENSGNVIIIDNDDCYAGEQINTNDFILLNGTSFNPDSTNTNTSIGGSEINKYAIGFTGNGESSNTFSVKTSVIEGAEPDAVTVNIETDDNGKPSGTVLATSSSLDFLKTNTSVNNTIISSSTATEYSSIQKFYFSNLGENEGNISYSSGIITVSGDTYNYTLDITGLSGYTSSMRLSGVCPNDKYLFFVDGTTTVNLYQLYLPNYFNLDGAEITKYTTVRISSSRPYPIKGCFDRTGHFFAIACQNTTSGTVYQSFGILYTETPFDLTNYTVIHSDSTIYDTGFAFIEYMDNSYVVYCGSSSSSGGGGGICKFNNDGTITVGDKNILGYSSLVIKSDIRKKNNIAYYRSGSSSDSYKKVMLGLERDYNYHIVKTITFDSSAQTTKGDKYWLTIAPTRTGSYVDNIKIYEKGGEYYSSCSVRDTDLSHNWISIANKTPYIDSNCILARYAWKSKQGITQEKQYGFSAWNYNEFEKVSYALSGVICGFSGLIPNTAYFSDGNGGITSENGTVYAGTSVTTTCLEIKTGDSVAGKGQTSSTVYSYNSSQGSRPSYAFEKDGLYVVSVWSNALGLSESITVYLNGTAVGTYYGSNGTPADTLRVNIFDGKVGDVVSFYITSGTNHSIGISYKTRNITIS